MSNNNHNGPKAFTRTYKSIHSEENPNQNQNQNTYDTKFKPMVKRNPNLVIKNVYFIKSTEDAIVPTKASLGSIGYDLYSVDDLVIEPGKTALINTGLKIVVPKGYEVQIRSRSGLALNKSIFVLNSPATIDWDYEGDIKIILHNLGCEAFEVKKGDRIAQAVFAPIILVRFKPNELTSGENKEDDDNNSRGSKGFGASGTRGTTNYQNNFKKK
jgi:dUTP pyrophosphatase